MITTSPSIDSAITAGAFTRWREGWDIRTGLLGPAAGGPPALDHPTGRHLHRGQPGDAGRSRVRDRTGDLDVGLRVPEHQLVAPLVVDDAEPQGVPALPQRQPVELDDDRRLALRQEDVVLE